MFSYFKLDDFQLTVALLGTYEYLNVSTATRRVVCVQYSTVQYIHAAVRRYIPYV